MRIRMALFALVIAAALAVPATAETVSIPKYTVIPVVLQNSLSSATANVGDEFYVKCAATQCAGFPASTQFKGVVTSVVRKSGGTPGQIDVSFVQAILPNGQRVDINGGLTSLHSNAVKTDPQTGALVGAVDTRDQRNKFIGYGAGTGLLIGALTGNVLKGGLIGAAAGWIVGATVGTERRAKEAVVPVGTEFGIIMQSPVTFTTAIAPPPVGAGPGAISVRLPDMQPFHTAAGTLMVPFRATMDALNQPFTYNTATKSITTTTDRGTIYHVIGTNYVMLDGEKEMLPAYSRVINGNLYVPADVFSIATGKEDINWNPSNDTLTME